VRIKAWTEDRILSLAHELVMRNGTITSMKRKFIRGMCGSFR